jgi:hypothetical protein
MCDFDAGDDVECIDNTDCEGCLEVGAIYRCTSICSDLGGYIACTSCGVEGSSEVLLEGVVHPGGWAFCACQFRKVPPPTTTVEQFTRVPVGDTNRWDKSRRKVSA